MTELARWPAWMGYPVVDDYKVEPQDRRIKSEMEISTISRVEFDTDETIANCSLYLKSLQAKWFESFERDYLSQGSKWFIMPLWVGGEIIDHVVKIRDRPALSQKSGTERTEGYAIYTFSLDVSKREGMLPLELVDKLLYLSPYELQQTDSLLQIIVNERLPKSLPFAA